MRVITAVALAALFAGPALAQYPGPKLETSRDAFTRQQYEMQQFQQRAPLGTYTPPLGDAQVVRPGPSPWTNPPNAFGGQPQGGMFAPRSPRY